jgi:Fic family protein
MATAVSGGRWWTISWPVRSAPNCASIPPSSAIKEEKSSYYRALESAQKGSLDITAWIIWFLTCLERSFSGAQETVVSVLRRERFYRQAAISPSQRTNSP